MTKHWLGNTRMLLTLAAALALTLIVACGAAAPEPASEPAQPAQPAAQQQQQMAEPQSQPSEPAAPAKQESSMSEPKSEPAQPAMPAITAQQNVPPTAIPVPAVEAPVAARLDKVAIAVGGQSWDSNYSYKVNIGGFLDKWPILEYLVGIDNATGEYTSELATLLGNGAQR